MTLFGKTIALVLIGISMTACTYRVHESNVVIPRAAPPADIDALRAAFPEHQVDVLKIPSSESAELYSLRFRRPDAVATVVYFGGNGYTAAKFAERTMQVYREAPVNVVVTDHRGYGASTGTPTIDSLMGDALRVYDHTLADPGLGNVPVILHGHSLGSFMAGHVASERKLAGLVLESSVTSTEDWTGHLRSRQSPWIRLLVRRVVPAGTLAGKGNQGVAAGIDEPVLFLVGADDDVTPPRFSQTLFEAAPVAPEDKHLVVVPGKNHMNAADSPEYKHAFSAFTARITDKWHCC
ncbi:alpha/beta hydrolase [Lysobacter korlensis]|uniref:Alpha/beta hydrolase n=1 Tax=Lysobacter korlensis TaxID=553636 RepID=A0ABV6RLZ8_9GAMM